MEVIPCFDWKHKILSGEPILPPPLDLYCFPSASLVHLDEALGPTDQPQAPKEQQTASAETDIVMTHLPTVEEVPAQEFQLSVDKIRSIQENMAECQMFLSVSIFLSSTYLCNRLVN